MTEDNGYPRVLDREGCIFGQGVERQVGRMVQRLGTLEEKVDKLRQAMVGAALSLGVAAVMLALNLVAR